MATTQIKRLYQNGTQFVPITLSEAVVVNTDNISLLNGQGITTLDKVLRMALGIVGNSTEEVNTLKTTVQTINELLNNKQDKLEAGPGIKIENGVISTTTSFTLYKVETTLPQPSESCLNFIYLIPSQSSEDKNGFEEYICLFKNNSYFWEKIGSIKTDSGIDLSQYVLKSEYQQKVATIESNLATINSDLNTIKTKVADVITAQNVTLSDNNTVIVVDYSIPGDLYDSMVNTDKTDHIM